MSASTINVAVIGAGSWGTTVAALAAVNTPTVLWARRSELAREINDAGVNPEYLPNFSLPEALRATDSLADAVSHADVVVMAVPSHGYRDVAVEAAESIRPWVPVVSLSKGLERTTLKRMSEVTADAMPGHPVAVLTGPNLAKEILSGQPAASVVAIDDVTIAERTAAHLQPPEPARLHQRRRRRLRGGRRRQERHRDRGRHGRGHGVRRQHARHARSPAGLAEMTRLGVAMGGQPVTFAGLAGMGDLIATCSSKQSRNNQVGLQLGQGKTIEEILAATNMVAEGVKSSPSVLDLARRYGVEMPITEQVVAVCHEHRPAPDALAALMQRSRKGEFDA